MTRRVCRVCGGDGYLSDPGPCPVCGGTGIDTSRPLPRTRPPAVPAGVHAATRPGGRTHHVPTPTNGPAMDYTAHVVTGRDDAAVTPTNPTGTTYGPGTVHADRDAAIRWAHATGGTVDVFGPDARRVCRVHVDGGIDYDR